MSLLLEGAAAAHRLRSLERSDPLSYFRFRCDGQRQLAQHAVDGLDTHAHAPNGGGKTLVSAALAVALCQGRRELDGVKLPGLVGDEPWVHWLIVPTRKQQVQASQKAVIQMLGGQPHEVGYSSRANDYIETVWIKPLHGRSDERANWSKLIFHCEESAEQSVPGGRVNSANADEAPLQRTWSEVRARWIAGRRLLLWIAETPTLKSRWWWLFHDDAGYRGVLGRPKGNRVAVNWTLVSVHGAAAVDQLREQYAGDPIIEARLTGFPFDDVSVTPFDGQALALYRAECLKPQVVRVPLFASGEDEHDRESLAQWAEYEFWCAPNDWGSYDLVGDPAKGLQAANRSPSAFQVLEEVDPALVARYHGRLDPYSFGWLAGEVGERYGAKVHLENQGGYGLEPIRALRRMRYPNIAREVRQNDPDGKPRHDYGFTTSEGLKRAWIAAIQQMLADKLAGRPACRIWSAAVIDCLADAVVDKETQKLLQDEHHRSEDIICLGKWLHDRGHAVHPRPSRRSDPVHAALVSEFGRDPRPSRQRLPEFPEAFRRP